MQKEFFYVSGVRHIERFVYTIYIYTHVEELKL